MGLLGARRALLGAVLAALPHASAASTVEGTVVAVADGDTLAILDASNTQHKIRLQSIDAPEKGQTFGQRSKENLADRRARLHYSLHLQPT